jgi:hypothetical protein
LPNLTEPCDGCEHFWRDHVVHVKWESFDIAEFQEREGVPCIVECSEPECDCRQLALLPMLVTLDE